MLSVMTVRGVAHAKENPSCRSRYRGGEAERALALLRARATMVLPLAAVQGVADDEEDIWCWRQVSLAGPLSW